MDSGDESDNDHISAEMLEDIREGGQSHLDVNKREAGYKIRDFIKQRKLERKGALKATRSMGKGLHKVFLTAVKDISQKFTPLGESVSEVSHLFQNLEIFLK